MNKRKWKEVLSMIDARKLLAERVNELCREKEITYEELSSKSEVPIETVLQMAYLLSQRPDAKMSDEQLEQLAPWSETAKANCQN